MAMTWSECWDELFSHDETVFFHLRKMQLETNDLNQQQKKKKKDNSWFLYIIYIVSLSYIKYASKWQKS